MISEHRFLGKHSQPMPTFEKEQRFCGKQPFSKDCWPVTRPAAKPNNDLEAGRNNLSQKASY